MKSERRAERSDLKIWMENHSNILRKIGERVQSFSMTDAFNFGLLALAICTVLGFVVSFFITLPTGLVNCLLGAFIGMIIGILVGVLCLFLSICVGIIITFFTGNLW